MLCPKCGSRVPEHSSFCNHCGSSLLEKPDSATQEIYRRAEEYMGLTFSAGDSFGKRYKIIEEIGRGGMGRVYKAEDNDLNIEVALKMIHPEFLIKSNIIKRFKKEILLAREISHENVVRIHDFGDIEGIKFISMQYIDGHNLKELIQTSGNLSIETVLNIASQILEGLKAAHHKGIVHKDLKPHNIMIDKTGKVFLTDFGLAEFIEGKDISQSGAAIGTPEYISPEQAKGERVDQRADIYNFGVILYEMITGNPPFTSDTVVGYLQKHLHESPIFPSKTHQSIPLYLERIILNCMEKDRRKRYQRVEEIQTDIKEEKVKSRPFYQNLWFSKSLKAAVTFVLVIAVAFGGYWVIKNIKKGGMSTKTQDKKNSVAVMYFENKTGDKNLDHWQRALPDLLITDLAQSRYFRVLSESRLFQILTKLKQLDTTRYSGDVLDQVASEGQVKHIIMGSFHRAGDVFRININVLDSRNGEIMYSDSIPGKGVESLFSIVDQLTRRVKLRFNLSRTEIAQDIDKEIRQITTTSQEALKHYVDGKKYFNEGEYKKSIESFEKAVSIDPQFAMAYSSMAWSYAYLLDNQNRKKYFLKTMELRDHISDKERYLIEGDVYSWSEDTFEKSIESYNKLLELYPNDNEGNLKMGMAYFYMNQWDEAINQFEVCRKNNDSSIQQYIFLSEAYMAKGMYKKSIEILDNYRDRFSDNELIYRGKYYSYLIQGDYNAALTEVENGVELSQEDSTSRILKLYIHLLKGNLEEAERGAEDFLKIEDKENWIKGEFVFIKNLYLLKGKYKECLNINKKGIQTASELGEKEYEKIYYIYLAYIHLKMNHPDKALKAASEALSERLKIEFFYSDRLALFFKSLSYLKMNDIKKALDTAEELKSLVVRGIEKDHIRYYYYIQGVNAIKNKKFEEAIDFFKKGISQLSHQMSVYHLNKNEHSLFMDALATAYVQTGNDEKAIELLIKIQTLTTGRISYGDIYTRSFYNLGKIYQEKGLQKEAIQNYSRFVFLWKNADTDIPELIDANEQLKILKK